MEQKSRKTTTTRNSKSIEKGSCCSASKTSKTTKNTASNSMKNCGGKCTGTTRKSNSTTKNCSGAKQSKIKSCS